MSQPLRPVQHCFAQALGSAALLLLSVSSGLSEWVVVHPLGSAIAGTGARCCQRRACAFHAAVLNVYGGQGQLLRDPFLLCLLDNTSLTGL